MWWCSGAGRCRYRTVPYAAAVYAVKAQFKLTVTCHVHVLVCTTARRGPAEGRLVAGAGAGAGLAIRTVCNARILARLLADTIVYCTKTDET